MFLQKLVQYYIQALLFKMRKRVCQYILEIINKSVNFLPSKCGIYDRTFIRLCHMLALSTKLGDVCSDSAFKIFS